MIQLFVFDMAGTTVDEDNVVYKTLHRAVEDAGYEVSLEEVLLLGAGQEKLQALKAILAEREAKPEVINGIFERFQDMLREAYDKLDVRPQPGSEKLFRYLREKGIKVVLNTGYNNATARNLLDKLNWKEGRDIDLLVTADQVANPRPKGDMIVKAMQHFGISDPSTVAKIGDSIIDIEEGRSASCSLSIGITTGAHTREQLLQANPDLIVESLDEIPKLLEVHGDN